MRFTDKDNFMANTLTATQVKQAKPKIKEYNLGDGHGLSLLIKPSGSKLWRFAYTHPILKKKCRLSIGVYPEISLAIARERAFEAKKLVATGIDPKENKDRELKDKQNQLSNTVFTLYEIWIEFKKTTVSPTTAKKISERFEKHIFPKLRNIPLDELSAPLVINTIKYIADNGNLYLVNKVCRELNNMIDHGINIGVIEFNKILKIGQAFPNPTTKHQNSLAPEDISVLFHKMNHSSTKTLTKCLIEWQLHTLTRPFEAAGAKWDEIDLNNKLWIIPSDRMKNTSDRKENNKDHKIPLTYQTLKLLEIIKAITPETPFIFPSNSSKNKHMSTQTVNAALSQRMGLKGLQTGHGLRALASTTLNEEAKDNDLIEAALSHKIKDKVRAAYNRTDYLERRRELMKFWSDLLYQKAQGKSIIDYNNFIS